MALRYCNEILDQFVKPYAGTIGPEFILMYDNTRPYCAHVTNVCNVRQSFVWNGLDLNPIEHAWDILQTAISARPVQPMTLQELKDA